VVYSRVVNLADWAETQGVSRQTAYQWFRAGKLPVPARRVGRLILVEAPSEAKTRAITVVYARVSSTDQRSDLDRQVARVTVWATGQGMAVDRVVTEVGSAWNADRKKFLTLLRDPSVTTIVVERRDRFARFGLDYIEAALAAQGRSLLVADSVEVDDDLVADMIENLTWFCTRLYGKRAAAHRVKKAVTVLTEPATVDGGPS
jgi:predicted site-specific integrase-resolvase